MAEDKEIDQSDFYTKAESYWENIPATVSGMLGGYQQVSSTDISSSKKFLLKHCLKDRGTKSGRALDCGAGIGRVSKLLLLPLFESVDMVELNEEFLRAAKNYIGPESSRIGNLYCCGLQNFTPEPGRYNVIWCQWVLGHLLDDDLVTFFVRCREGLTDNGVIVVKENFTGTSESELDEVDSSFTRPREDFLKLADKSGLKVINEEKQKNFPKEIYDVRMFVMR